MQIIRWIIYTVLVGALPMIVRLLVYLISNHYSDTVCVTSVDIVFFGLTLNISNINEVNNLKYRKQDKNIIDVISNQRDLFVGISTFFIILLAISLGALYIGEMSPYNIINNTTARIGAVALGGMSLVFSCIVMYNVLKLIHHGNA